MSGQHQGRSAQELADDLRKLCAVSRSSAEEIAATLEQQARHVVALESELDRHIRRIAALESECRAAKERMWETGRENSTLRAILAKAEGK